jgi:PRC-barrel domain
MPDAMSWLGMRIDDAYGARVGDVDDVYLESDGSPRWIFARPGRVLIPAAEAMAGAGRVWVPYEKEQIKGAPAVSSLDHVTPEHEAATWRWYSAEADHTGWVSHGKVPWVRGYDADAARRHREAVRSAPPAPPEPLPPLHQTYVPPQPQQPQVQQAPDGRQVVMVFNIGCDESAQRAPLRAVDDGWDEAAARALQDYARRTGTYR